MKPYLAQVLALENHRFLASVMDERGGEEVWQNLAAQRSQERLSSRGELRVRNRAERAQPKLTHTVTRLHA